MAAWTSCSATVNVQGERELKNDDRAASGANGSHLVQTGQLSEWPLERRSDGRGRNIRTCAGIKSNHLDGPIIHLRQRRNRQLPISHNAREQNNRENRGEDPE